MTHAPNLDSEIQEQYQQIQTFLESHSGEEVNEFIEFGKKLLKLYQHSDFIDDSYHIYLQHITEKYNLPAWSFDELLFEIQFIMEAFFQEEK